MKILHFKLKSPVRWKCTQNDSDVIPIPLPLVEGILTPLTAYELLSNDERMSDYTFYAMTKNNELVIQTDAICFVVSSPMASVAEQAEAMSEVAWRAIPQFLSVVRAVSGQADIPTSWPTPVTSSWFIETEKLQPPVYPRLEGGSPRLIIWGDYIWHSAITSDDIVTAHSHLVNDDLPNFKLIFADAVKAAMDFDAQKCILYSAFAMETAARFVMGEAVEQRNHALSVSTDPVYEYLKKNNGFRIWLHEVAHYGIGRSLLIENKKLYDQALRLYDARSKFAHAERSKPQQNEFTNTPEGALEALQCLKHVLDWFGEGQRYTVPIRGLCSVVDFALNSLQN